MAFWDKRAGKLGKHRHLPEDILEDETGTASILSMIYTGTADPTGDPGVDALVGSIYLRQSATNEAIGNPFFVKTAPGVTGWQNLVVQD